MKSSAKPTGVSARILGLIAATLAAGAVTQAAPQRFAFNYEATSLSAGQFEFENKVSWGHTKSSDGVEFGHELEYGITDNFQIAAILSEWSYEKADGEGSETNWGSAGLELFYSFANPATDPFGGAVLLESRLGDEEFALEGRLILQKNLGAGSLVYNIGLEGVWEGSNYDEAVGEFEQTLGYTYGVGGGFNVGIEAVHDAAWVNNWKDLEENVLYVGPSVGFRAGSFWFSAGGGWNVTNRDDEAADFVGKLRVGVVF